MLIELFSDGNKIRWMVRFLHCFETMHYQKGQVIPHTLHITLLFLLMLLIYFFQKIEVFDSSIPKKYRSLGPELLISIKHWII